MSRRRVSYADEASALADIARLRKSHTAEGDWTLEQACYHCAWPLKHVALAPATAAEPNDQQKPMRAFLDGINAAGVWPDTKMEAPPMMAPPPSADASSIDDYIAGLTALAACKIPVLENHAFGPLPIDVYRRFTLIHAAHHFSHFHPTA